MVVASTIEEAHVACTSEEEHLSRFAVGHETGVTKCFVETIDSVIALCEGEDFAPILSVEDTSADVILVLVTYP